MPNDALSNARKALDGGDLLAGQILIAADVQAIANKAGVQLILVGGLCADIWTASTFAHRRPDLLPELTRDVDMVSAGSFATRDAARARQALKEAGYEPRSALETEQARDWNPPGLDILIQVMTPEPWPYDSHTTIHSEGHILRLWDPETTFWQYAENAWSQGLHRGDWIRARSIASANPDMDWENLRKRAGDLAWIVQAARDQVPIEELSDRQP